MTTELEALKNRRRQLEAELAEVEKAIYIRKEVAHRHTTQNRLILIEGMPFWVALLGPETPREAYRDAPWQGEVVIGHTTYTVLTGYEGQDHRCFWCGGELKGKLKRYCYGHMTLYYNHFNWGYASWEARRRADYRCENCGQAEVRGRDEQTNLEVHHIVPLRGEPRFFSAFNPRPPEHRKRGREHRQALPSCPLF